MFFSSRYMFPTVHFRSMVHTVKLLVTRNSYTHTQYSDSAFQSKMWLDYIVCFVSFLPAVTERLKLSSQLSISKKHGKSK